MISKLRNLKRILTDILTIRSDSLFKQERSFFFRVFRHEYQRYKKWIEPNMLSPLPIDIIIPVIDKDLDVLPYVISSAYKHVRHPIGNVFIVAPNSEAIKAEVAKTKAVFIDESTVCDIKKDDINYVVNGKDRSGWIYQQLLKYNFTKVAQYENYLVIDADTFFVKDVCFEARGKFYLDFSDEYHNPYYQAFEILTGLKHRAGVSFVAHYMFFNKVKVEAVKKQIEKHTGKTLLNAIKELKLEIDDQSAFSEYETYANYCIQTNPGLYTTRYWFNKSYSKKQLGNAQQIIDHAGEYKSVSFHSHNIH
jgi:hypothetical protein